MLPTTLFSVRLGFADMGYPWEKPSLIAAFVVLCASLLCVSLLLMNSTHYNSHASRRIVKVYNEFVSAVNGKMLPSEVHGKPSGRKFDIVTIDDPEEYLTSVSGQHGINKLVSVTFGTNKRKYGPFGSVIKGSLPPFVYNFSPKSSFGGFHGSVLVVVEANKNKPYF
ncbi:hypothetical protein L2E82_06097 [Cichorium intybus]|uniref:Uncharacterized protein n=1 Tax=Cichorium intybus TaxID=13427 RepID=A0ACB9H8X2_CICIN|nr:hypothetical protein L2E82_06097 [Cichorium intybus]